MNSCQVSNCGKQIVAWKMCDKHYRRWKLYGSTEDRPSRRIEPVERFLRHIEVDVNGHWIWTGAKAGGKEHLGRYGVFDKGYAHRFSYEYFIGEIPEGYEVMHKCDLPACTNPDCLFVGTHLENVRDMDDKGRRVNASSLKTHCPRGHTYSGTNIYGRRICRTCNRDNARARERAKKEAIA